MWGYVAVGIFGWLFADAVSVGVTDKHLHEHLYDWWLGLKDFINDWLHANSELRICQIGILWLDKLDKKFASLKRATDSVLLGVVGADAQGNEYEITLGEISQNEAFAQFPQFREYSVLTLEV